jgi:hypothetical protein
MRAAFLLSYTGESMKQITVIPAELPYRLVNFGIDTLLLNVRYADETGKPRKGEAALLPEYLVACLNAWQALAKEQEQPVSTPLEFEQAALQMYPHGAGRGQWRWLLTCPAFTLLVSRGRLNGVVAQVRFSSPYLWSSEDEETRQQNIWPLVVKVRDFLSEFFTGGRDLMALQVSELHLCADLVGWDVASCQWDRSFISRARLRFDHPEQSVEAGGPGMVVYVGRRLATLTFGSHASPLSCCIYRKSLEIKTSGKLWFEDIWRRHGWDGSSEVWRVEYRWRREALHELKQEGVFHGIESIEDVDIPGRLSFLWTYGAGHVQGGPDGWPDGWLRCVVPSDTESNVSRWPVHPAWSVVQSAFTTETEQAVNIHTGEVVEVPLSPLADLIRQRHYEVNVRRLSQQIGGCASTLAAWLGGPVDSLPQVLDRLIELLPRYALPDLAKVAPLDRLQAEYAARFAERIAEKRAVYGLAAPAPCTEDAPEVARCED